jgi:siroheme decarboxylase
VDKGYDVLPAAYGEEALRLCHEHANIIDMLLLYVVIEKEPLYFMDEIDRKILNEIQTGFPITQRPYSELGERLGIPEDTVLKRVTALKAEGIIRRIGGSLDSRKLDFTSTLCAAAVPEETIESFVKTVNGYKGVTHNYLRNNVYNIWFTFIGPNAAYIETCLSEISAKTGVDTILNMPAVRIFKIRVDFEV